MTTDEFDTRYKLLKQITNGHARSFTAQERAGGRGVLVHFLDEGPASDPSAAALIERLEPRDRSKILEILVVDDSTVIVSQVLEGFQDFDTWLRARLGEPPAPVVPSPSGGGFTEMFQPPAESRTGPIAKPPAPPGRSPAEPEAPQGGFTELFQPPAESRTGPVAKPPAPPAKPPAPPAKSPAAPEAPKGGFTDLFQPPPVSRTDPVPAPAPAKPPLELRSVRIPMGQPPPPHPRPVTPPPAWPSAPTFEPPLPPPSLKPAVPVPRLGPRPGEPIVKPPGPPVIKPPARQPLPPPASVPGWGGESDYTRQLRPAPPPVESAPPAGAPPRGVASPAGPPAGSPEPPAPPKSIVPLLLVLNIIVVIATGLILYFALKRR